MSQEHSVSRRTSLKSLGAVGAAMVFGGATPPQTDAGRPGQDTPVNVVDLAAGRMSKGHS